MAGKRSIFIFWVLILVPALILTCAAIRQLSLEQTRIREAANQAMTEWAKTISGSVDLTVTAVQDNLTQALLDLHSQNLMSALAGWEKTNPLVRNFFIYSAKTGLVYPRRDATREEQDFIRRFEPLFSGRLPFNFDQAPRDAQKDSPAVSSVRKSLYRLSREPEGKKTQAVGSGWIPWFSDNRLHILGWVQKRADGPVYGVELELMTLLSRLVTDFQEINRSGTALVLLDGSGQVLHRQGTLTTEGPPFVTFAVSRRLPHWQLAVYADQTVLTSGRPFFIIALILTGILVISILSGGIMMTRLTLAKMRDARQKTSFVASVSHELKTPLTSIRMYAELLLSGRAADPSKKERYLGVIVAESLRLTRLINNVLDFGRLEQGRKTYHRTPFDMAEFLDALIRDQEIRMGDLLIKKEVSSGSFMVNTDRDAVEQAILNLIDNALKYAGQGRFLEFLLDRDGGDVRLRICDDGPGVDKGVKEKIFDKFFRADDSITADKPGSGLGLSIARQMLRDLGGELFLEDLARRKTGACFTMRIPHED